MGISVILSPAPAKPPAAGSSLAGTGSTENASQPGDFAALLLSGQLASDAATHTSSASIAATTLSASATVNPEKSSPRAKAASLESTPTDTTQTLAMLMALPASSVPAQANHDIKLDATLNGQAQTPVTEGGTTLDRLVNTASENKTAEKSTSASPLPGNAEPIAAAQTPEPKPLPGIPSEPETANIAAGSFAQSLNQANAALSNSNHADKGVPTTPTATEISTPLHSTSWPQDFTSKVVWLAKNDQQSAQININPPQLGPIQISLHIAGDQATVTFGTPHAEVRQAIEGSLSQLKDMLSASGINLGQADVGANLAQQNRDTAFQTANGNRSANETAILPGIGNTMDSAPNTLIQSGRGMVDLFA